MKLSDLKFRNFTPTFEEMIDTCHEAFSNEFFKMFPWNAGEKPSLEEIVLIYKDKEVQLTGFYLQACILLNKEIPVKYRDPIERQIDPESYFEKLDRIEQQLTISFNLYMSTKPTLEEAINKLIQLSKDYWEEDLSPELARKQILQDYKDSFL